jgi:hypothetical protein
MVEPKPYVRLKISLGCRCLVLAIAGLPAARRRLILTSQFNHTSKGLSRVYNQRGVVAGPPGFKSHGSLEGKSWPGSHFS